MESCSECGVGQFVYLGDGGCGGYGQLRGCEYCKAVFKQTTGGIAPTPGGECWERQSFSLDEYRNKEKKKGRKETE